MNTSILTYTMHGTLTNQETLAEVDEVKEEDSHDEQNENDDGEPVAKPGIEEVRNAVKFPVILTIWQKFENINCSIDKNELCNKKKKNFYL